MTPVLQVDSLPLCHLGSPSIDETIINVMPVYFTVGNVAVKSKVRSQIKGLEKCLEKKAISKYYYVK